MLKGSCRLQTASKAAGVIDKILLSCDKSSCFKDCKQLRCKSHLSRVYPFQEVRSRDDLLTTSQGVDMQAGCTIWSFSQVHTDILMISFHAS